MACAPWCPLFTRMAGDIHCPHSHLGPLSTTCSTVLLTIQMVVGINLIVTLSFFPPWDLPRATSVFLSWSQDLQCLEILYDPDLDNTVKKFFPEMHLQKIVKEAVRPQSHILLPSPAPHHWWSRDPMEPATPYPAICALGPGLPSCPVGMLAMVTG